MSGFTVERTETLYTIVCGKCGILFAVPDKFDEARRKDGKNFYCPNGDPRAYCDTERKQAKRALVAEEQRREQAEAEAQHQREYAESVERRLAATKGAHTKTKKRIAAGMCPCCQCPFANLMQHMQNQHPDYAQPPGAEE